MNEKKWHKYCGGKVVYQEPPFKTYFEFGGYCLKCEEFPILEEDIIFKIDDNKYEKFIDNTIGWKIYKKKELEEILD